MTLGSRHMFALAVVLIVSCTFALGQEPENSVVFRDEDQTGAACIVWDYVDYIEDTNFPFFVCVDDDSESRVSLDIRSENGWVLVLELTSDELTFGDFRLRSLDDDMQTRIEYRFSGGDSRDVMGFVLDRLAIVDIDEGLLNDLEASDWIAFRVNSGITHRVRLPDAREATAEFRERLEANSTL